MSRSTLTGALAVVAASAAVAILILDIAINGWWESRHLPLALFSACANLAAVLAMYSLLARAQSVRQAYELGLKHGADLR
ncbi:hypothetical protein [Bailinhaonella thermotolerans]|uniref:GGDEF domain-containing protein n=1 Tax=Bailinhaonella thermotolerans TaxID=1070861 RepID=A0A3A4A1P9_9ACTN|nr:hypothetical protein [Bailinhaonella thermotolerans]RJL21074.1 hypothetical protein D5H75_38320 [Bailinhaonella thermotolerans]